MTLTLEAKPVTRPHHHHRLATLHRAAVTHLARVLYLVHLTGWRSLSLTPGTSSGSRLSSTAGSATPGGYVRYRASLPVDGVVREINTMITEGEYRRALAQLSEAQRADVRGYYQRRVDRWDVCPALEGAAFGAFEALLAQLAF